MLNIKYDWKKIFRKKLNNKEDEAEIKNIRKKIEGLDLLDNNNYLDINSHIELITNTEKYKEKTEKYIDKIKNLCCNYESWFVSKIGRIKRKK